MMPNATDKSTGAPSASPSASAPWPQLHWAEHGEARSARWRSENGMPPPKRVQIADDSTSADTAYRLACEGTGLLWRGDFQNARQLLLALARRIDQPAAVGAREKKRARAAKAAAAAVGASPATGDAVNLPSAAVAPAETHSAQAFHLYRQAQSQRARVLAMLLIPHDADHGIPLRRAPDVRQACREAYGDGGQAETAQPYVASLREMLGLIGAHEWRRNGVEVAALAAAADLPAVHIHPHYGVFAPIRSEYVDLVAQAPLPPGATALAFDIGTGTGVLAAVLARRGVRRIVATDQSPRALACARDNMARLALDRKSGGTAQVEVVQADLFAAAPLPQRAALVVCNPPWLPARAGTPLEQAVYDPDSRMLRGFLAALPAHLTPDGEGWLIMSDLAEHLGLRSREELPALIAAAGLAIAGKSDIHARHPRAADKTDVLHTARAQEVTSLWRLKLKR